MAESIIFNIPEEVRPEHIERYMVPVNNDGSLHLDRIHFRAFEGEEQPMTDVIAVIAGQDGSPFTSRIAYILGDGSVTVANDPSFDGGFGHGVAYNGSRWVVVTDGDWLYSDDGINWNSTITPFGIGGGMTGLDVVWADTLGLFVAGGEHLDQGPIATSSDGVSWSVQTTPWDSDFGYVNGVAWSNDLGQLLALGNSEASSGIYYVMLTSSDGITWTSVDTTPAVGNQLNDAVYSPDLSLWVAVGPAGDGKGVYSSPDGITWTPRLPTAGPSAFSICWSSPLGLFAWADDSTSVACRTSPDGINWNIPSTPPFVGVGSNGVDWSSLLNKFIMVASNSHSIYTSTDGDIWINEIPNSGFFGQKIFCI